MLMDRISVVFCAVALAILLAAAVLIALASRRAHAGGDPVISYFEGIFQTYPGQMIPADARFPTAPRLRYLRTTALPGGVYAIYVKKIDSSGR